MISSAASVTKTVPVLPVVLHRSSMQSRRYQRRCQVVQFRIALQRLLRLLLLRRHDRLHLLQE